VTVNYFVAGTDGKPTATSCGSGTAGSSVAVGCLAVVTFETTYQPITPIVSQLLFSSGVTMTARTVLPVEYTCPSAKVAAGACPKQP